MKNLSPELINSVAFYYTTIKHLKEVAIIILKTIMESNTLILEKL